MIIVYYNRGTEDDPDGNDDSCSYFGSGLR